MRSGSKYKNSDIPSVKLGDKMNPKHCITVRGDGEQYTMPDVVVRYCISHPISTGAITEETFGLFLSHLADISKTNDDRKTITEQTENACKALTSEEKVNFLRGVVPFARAIDIYGAVDIDISEMIEDKHYGDMAAEIFLWVVEWLNKNIIPACVFFPFLADYMFCDEAASEPAKPEIIHI